MPTFDPRRALADPRLYNLVQRGVGAERARRLFVSRFLRPEPGMRILDIGCGTGSILDFLPPVEYVGFDLSQEYVAAARARYGERGRFHCVDVLQADLGDEAPFDAVIATGVIHHLDDRAADRLVSIAAAGVGPSGRLLSWDGAFVPGQPRVARILLERDRGEHIRSPEGYVALCRPHFAHVRHELVTDFLHIPYTHCVLQASHASL